ncbi:MAG: hypothetical protein ACFFD4_06640 [Candidatus Odinarchaeota archaeon]
MSIMPIINLIVIFSASGTSVLLIVTLFIRYRQTKIPVILLLLFNSIVGVFSYSAEMLSIITNYQLVSSVEYFSSNFYTASNLIFQGLGLISACMILLFIDYFANESFSHSRLAISVGVVTGYTVSVFFMLGLSDSVTGNLGDYLDPVYGFLIPLTMVLSTLGTAVFLLYVFASGYRSIESVKTYAIGSEQKKQLSLMQVALLFYYVVTVLSISFISFFLSSDPVPYELGFIFLNIIPRASVMIGDVLLWITYARSTSASFLQPQRMDTLLVIKKTGIPVYTHDFRVKQETDSILLSGGITAIKSLLKEAVGTATEIVSIKFLDKELLVSSRKEFGAFLIVDRPSRFLVKALTNFSQEFEEEYSKVLADDLVDSTAFQGAEKLVRAAFGV